MELFVLVSFCVILLGCIFLDISILYALLIGLCLFLGYGRYKKVEWKELIFLSIQGIRTIKNILMTFTLIGILTAMWRACGTIPYIISHAIPFMSPQNFIVATFLLNCLLSVLTGTSFGTAATMGVICITMAKAMNVSLFWTGGAMMSGIFFGDRCSPLSTSALLVSTLTETDIFDNIKNMIRTCIVPFIVTVLFYLLVGFTLSTSVSDVDVNALFQKEYILHWTCILPALIVLVLSVFKIKVKRTMIVSIIISIFICIFIQHQKIYDILHTMLLGYTPKTEELSSMLSGGGILSMVRVGCIVCISSCYAGLFQGTGLLDSIYNQIQKLAKHVSVYTVIMIVSILVSLVACNQTLTIMLTHQLCKDLEKDNSLMALNLEDSAVVLSPLVPWSIAGSAPIQMVGAPISCLLAGIYLYLLPISRILLKRSSY